MNVGITIGVSPEAFTGIIQSLLSGIMKKPPGLSVSTRAELEKACTFEKRLGLGNFILQ